MKALTLKSLLKLLQCFLEFIARLYGFHRIYTESKTLYKQKL
ncbi:hypothetical protein [uncultured Helicobacter sp.]|nr:hypothetical protein [uncultured Helicobacter sp.]